MLKKRKIQLLLLAIVIVFSCFLTCFKSTIQNVYASSINVVGGYTSVLDDLKKDASFDENKYPVIADDYSLQVMHITESNEKELFVYVYQPSAEYKGIIASLSCQLTYTSWLEVYGRF